MKVECTARNLIWKVLKYLKDYKYISFSRNVLIVIVANTLLAIGSGLTAPLLVRYLEVLGATPSVIGILMSFEYFLLFLGLVGGYVSDRFGRRTVLFFTHLIFAFSLLWFVFAENWVWVIPGIVLAFGTRAFSRSVVDAILADSTMMRERGRVYSIYWILVTISAIVSSFILAYFVVRFGVYEGVRLGFTTYFILALIATLLFYLLKEETQFLGNINRTYNSLFAEVIKTIKSSGRFFQLFLVYYIAVTPGRIILITYYPLYLVHVVNASDATVAGVFGIGMMIYLLTQIAIGPVVDRVTNRSKVLFIFLILTLLCTFFLVLLYNNLVVSTVLCIIIIATLFLEQYMHIIFMADVTAKENRGVSLGLIRTIIGSESALSIIFGGILFELSPFYPFFLSIASLFLSLILLKRLRSV